MLKPALRFSVGGNGAQPNQNFEGSIDEVQIWNRALTDLEVADNYLSPVNTSDPDLKMYLSLNQGPGGTVTVAPNLAVITVIGQALFWTLHTNYSNSSIVGGPLSILQDNAPYLGIPITAARERVDPADSVSTHAIIISGLVTVMAMAVMLAAVRRIVATQSSGGEASAQQVELPSGARYQSLKRATSNDKLEGPPVSPSASPRKPTGLRNVAQLVSDK
jgi:hypothetical protein